MDHYRILVTEDDPAIGQSLLDGLKHYGFSANLLTIGSDGLEYIKKHVPHLVILDVRLPNGSGFDFCRQLRQGRIHRSLISHLNLLYNN